MKNSRDSNMVVLEISSTSRKLVCTAGDEVAGDEVTGGR